MKTKALIALFAFIIFGCAAESLRELQRLYIVNSDPISAQVNFCTIEANKVKSKLKFIFVLDKSGSNQDGGGFLGTDPNGARRYTSLISFLTNATDDPTVFFSLINFSTDATVIQPFTNDRASFLNVVRTQANPSGLTPPQPADGGWTNYISAFGKVQNLIDQDIQAAKLLPEITSSYYIVLFVSDGAPEISQGVFETRNDIFNSIDNFIALGKNYQQYVDSIQLHTGYYFNSADFDPNAQSIMQDMAQRGNGQFYQFGAGQSIDFNQFAVPERNVKHNLKDVFVTNISTVWYNGQLYLDSDHDTLPDELEMMLGSDPYKYDSDNNGVSDGVEYRATGSPCKDAKCSPDLAEPYLACNAYLQPAANGLRLFTDYDKDLLNDCEERVVLGSKIDDFDSNRDGLPDELAFRGNVAIVEGTQEATLDPDFDGYSNYTEVKINTPPHYPNDQIVGLRPYRYSLQVVSDNASQTCYNLSVSNIAAIGDGNLIRVYILENSAIIDAKRFLRIAERQASGTSVVFTGADFQ